MLPPMKLSYTEMVSEVKLNILRALDKAGGSVDSLDELSKLTDYGKPLLSYHIHGSEDAEASSTSASLMPQGTLEARQRLRSPHLEKCSSSKRSKNSPEAASLLHSFKRSLVNDDSTLRLSADAPRKIT